MSAPAVPAADVGVRARTPRAKVGVDRWGGVVEVWLRAHTAIVYAFLYLPIVVVVLFSFNANRARDRSGRGSASAGTRSRSATEVVQGALMNSFSVGAAQRDRRDDRRDDGGPRPAAGPAPVPVRRSTR